MRVSVANPSPAQRQPAGRTKTVLAPFDAPVLLRLWHLTSLDAPTVAVVWSLSFAWAVGVDLPRWVPLLLALGTWCVYVSDRLLDARAALRLNNLSPLRERHFFHWRHRRLLVPLACCAAIFAAAIVFSLMPITIRERNSVLAFAALAYFSGVHLPGTRPKHKAPLYSKEFLVGVLFTAGCAFPVFARIHTAANLDVSLWPFLIVAVYFATLAWLNCSGIERWESANGAGISSAAFSLAALGLLATLGFFSHQPRVSAQLLAGSSSAALLGALDVGRGRLTPLALRCAADLVLLTPMLCLLR
jgi:hypothetical protein